MLAYVKTDVGLVRENNEDSYIFLPPRVFIVADGMGGHVAGEIASQMASTMVSEYIEEHRKDASPQLLLEQAINKANLLIYQMSQHKQECHGMGTTITAAYVEGNTVYFGHVGDSRMYLIHAENMRQITEDHSLVWELVKSGNITREEASVHPQRNMLTRALGTSPAVKIDTGAFTWDAGDKLLLCSDGLTNMMSEQAIFEQVRALHDSMVLDKLVEQAKAAGGHDNITVILAQNGDK
ncbi:MAG: Stp1/IreP family PP2C-type Ser/Thr phosphatase [Pelosinus sp.]|nr:Stp1/IreP family PP2C-type Ser/Thr phosphatase [Pelosinus sp.]